MLSVANKTSAVEFYFPGINPHKGLGAFPEWPAQWQLDQLRQHGRTTGFPEDNPAICLAPIEVDAEHHIVGVFDLALSARPNGKPVWCSICQTWKFGSGRFLYTPSDGAVRLVGKDCARDHFGEDRWQQMNVEANRRATRRDNEEFLIETLPRLGERIQKLEQYETMAQELQGAHAQLFREAPRLAASLQTARRESGGALTVQRRLKPSGGGPAGMRTSSGVSNYTTHVIGNLRGLVFLRSTFKPQNELRRMCTQLSTLQCVTTEDEALNRIVEFDEERITQEARNLRGLLEDADRLQASIIEASGFLSEKTFTALAKWMADPDCPCSAEAELSSGRLRIREKDSVSVSLRPVSQLMRFGR